jgi:quinol monooxygenase YgiN
MASAQPFRLAEQTNVRAPSRITIVTRRRLYPGQLDAFLALIPVPGRRQRLDLLDPIRVFQSRTDPQSVLVVREWPSREAWLQRDAAGRPTRDALTDGVGEHRFYRWLHRYVIVDRPILHATAAFFRCPDTTRAAAVAYLREAGPRVHQQPGCVHRTLYEDLDDPNHLLVVTGWASLGTAESARQTLWPQLDAALQTIGTQLEFFRGRTRLEVGPGASRVD